MIYPDRKDGVRLVTDPIMPHREVDSHSAMQGVQSAPDDESYREGMRRALWRHIDRELTLTVSQRLSREMRGE